VSPRYEPRVRRKPPQSDPPDVALADARMRDEHSRLAALQGSMEPYRLQHSPHERYDVVSEQFLPADPPGADVRVPSFWHDLLLEREAEVRAQLAHGRDPGNAERPWADEELAEASERLRAVREFDRYELDRLAQRDLTSSGFVPANGPPMFLAERFAVAARARAGLFMALPQEPLPQAGDHIEVPRLTTGAAVAVAASENATVQETDPASALASSNKALIAGQVDVSRQLLEFSRPGIDEVLALDLGNDTGLKIDSQLIAGTNANGQTLGLANVPSINTVTYTSATPTAAALISKIWNAFQLIADSGGGPSQPGEGNYIIAVAPRRAAALGADQGQTSATPVLPGLPGALVVTSGIRQNLGAGTNEDEVYVIARNEVFVALGRPVFQVFEQVGSSTGTVRLQSRSFCAAMFARQPKAIARISGTGLVTPTF
jgi:Phage capsid family